MLLALLNFFVLCQVFHTFLLNMQFTPCNVMFQQIVPPVLNSFSDQDSRVRYYACEALYNIAKVRYDLYSAYFFFVSSVSF